MSHYTVLYKYDKHTRDLLGAFLFYVSIVFYILWEFLKAVIPIALVEYEMIIASSYLTGTRAIIIIYKAKEALAKV